MIRTNIVWGLRLCSVCSKTDRDKPALSVDVVAGVLEVV